MHSRAEQGLPQSVLSSSIPDPFNRSTGDCSWTLNLCVRCCVLCACVCCVQLDKASRAGGAAGSKRSSVGGIGSVLPLLVVAVLAFLVGHFLQQGLPALQQLVNKGGDAHAE